MRNQHYNPKHLSTPKGLSMAAQDLDSLTDFGRRMVALRTKAGYTQVELAKELGITQRMISYYEGHTDYPPSALLPDLAEVLGVSTDQLLGIKPIKKTPKPDTRLQRRIKQIEKLGTKEKRQVIQLMDTFIEAAQLKKQVKA